jgi:soluble lytic murein transglycosylase
MSVERADERVTPNLPIQLVRGTDRDFLSVMIGVLMHGVLLASAAACQQGERRESAGDVAATVPMRPTPVSSFDDDVRAAQGELAEGRGWFATRRVAPALKDSVRRTPEAVLVAARAAAAWAGWDEVQKLLVDEPWLASRFSGEGHELLARSALERNDASGARTHAEAALRLASDQTARAIRMVLLARALDRLDVRDSAAGTYRRAADALPAVREWLLLRAAGSTADAKARERLYSGIRGPATRARVPHTEAQTLERFRADLAAADAYEKLGDMPSAYRLRLQSSDQVQRSGIRAGLLGYIQRDARGGNLARALEVLDAAFPQLDPTSQLVVTRRAAEGGVSGRAMTGFARVPAALLTDADVISWARALIASGKPTEAASRIAARRFGAVAAPEAAYVRGLALVRAGRTTLARAALQRVTTSHASSPHAADALYLLADLESDAGRESRARDLFQRACVAKAPGSFSDEACFRAGILSYALGNARLAATAFDELPRRFPASQEVSAARYWAGRAWERTGNAALARERWSAVLQREPLSFYASGSARRLGTKQWTPAPAQVPRSPRFQGALTRAAVLEHLGMDTEERYEYEGIESEAAAAPAEALTAGAALLDRGEVVRAIRLGWRAVTAAREGRDPTSGPMDERGYSLAYPLLREVQLLARSRANNLDPALVAAIIRQESSWNPRAESHAGARGLMQIMPRVGEAIARSHRYPVWDPALLFDPDVSLELGTAHLRAALSATSNLPRALAAYNAGGSRVRRWARRTGASDPELFIERIPFVETRDYVRIVLRNIELYRALHGLRK